MGVSFVLTRQFCVGSWMGFTRGMGHQKDPAMIISLELSALPLVLQGGQGPEIEFIIVNDCTYLMKPWSLNYKVQKLLGC